jgi:hypothetical protein
MRLIVPLMLALLIALSPAGVASWVLWTRWNVPWNHGQAYWKLEEGFQSHQACEDAREVKWRDLATSTVKGVVVTDISGDTSTVWLRHIETNQRGWVQLHCIPGAIDPRVPWQGRHG